MIKKRIPYIDCIRVFACFLVVSIHCNYSPSNSSGHIYSQILNVIGSPSSELFLTISGALLIPLKTSVNVFFKKRFYKLLPPLITWSLIGIIFITATKQKSTDQIWMMFCSIPFKNSIIPVFWFMYTIIGLYLLAPVISPFIDKYGYKGVRFLLYLWMLTITFPTLDLFFPEIFPSENDPKNMLSSFYGYAGYMILGYYLKAYPFSFTKKEHGWIIPFFALIIIIIIIGAVGYYVPENRDYVLGNLSLVNMLYVVSLFTLIQSIFQKDNYITRTASKITKYTFGVYLIHVFVIYYVYLIFEKDSYAVILQLPLTALLSFALSLFIVWGLSKIKCLSWTVQGFKEKPLSKLSNI